MARRPFATDGLAGAAPKWDTSGMKLFQGIRHDDPLRILVPIGAPCVLLLALGMIFPQVVIVVITYGAAAATIAVAYLLFRFVQKFLGENRGPGCTLDTWRPTVLSGLRTGCCVLLQWAPFGFLALLVFGANGLIVNGIEWLLTMGMSKLAAGASNVGREVGAFSCWPIDRLRCVKEALQSIATELKGVETALYNLLVVVRYIFVVETYVSWIFLTWLTTRSVLYFLSRRVLVEQSLAPDAESSPIEIRFDMEFTR